LADLADAVPSSSSSAAGDDPFLPAGFVSARPSLERERKGRGRERAAVLCDLGEESEVGGEDSDDFRERSEVGGGDPVSTGCRSVGFL
jgi:hypothetical protein